MAVIFSFLLNYTLGSLCSSLVVLPDTENMGVAIEILLLSCVQAEIQVFEV